jgi:Putative transposase of IS4/5 family (DUF4096)
MFGGFALRTDLAGTGHRPLTGSTNRPRTATGPHQRPASTSDLSDEERQILAPLLPPEKPGGRPRKYPRREVLNSIPYVLRGGCAWRLMPHDLPHGQTAYQYFRAWRQDDTWLRLHNQPGEQ